MNGTIIKTSRTIWESILFVCLFLSFLFLFDDVFQFYKLAHISMLLLLLLLISTHIHVVVVVVVVVVV